MGKSVRMVSLFCVFPTKTTLTPHLAPAVLGPLFYEANGRRRSWPTDVCAQKKAQEPRRKPVKKYKVIR